MRALASLPAAALGGALWSLCFAAEPHAALAWVALVPLLAVLDTRGLKRRLAVACGLLHGLVYWTLAVSWILGTVTTFGGLPRAAGALAVLGVALLEGVWHGVFALVALRLLRHRALFAMAGLAAAWTVLDWLRAHVPGVAFPWNLSGYAWVAMPGALSLSAWIGTHGLSFLLVFANAGLALGIRRRRWLPLGVGVLLALLALALAARFGQPPQDDTGRGDTGPRAGEVVLVQPGSPLLDASDDPARAYGRLLAMSRSACARPAATAPGGLGPVAGVGQGPRLLVWPESAAYPDTWDQAPRLRRAVLDLAARGCAVLLNTPLAAERGVGIENAALLVPPHAPPAHYAKQRLVPFGETVPLGDLLPFIGVLARIPQPFEPGRRVGVLPWAGGDLGISICYEVTFPELVAAEVRAGASLLTTITNDAWYGKTAAPYQHLRAARFRAAENRRPLVRAALTGISAVIDARGRVVERLAVGAVGTLRTAAPGKITHLSPYTRAPWLVPGLCLMLLLAFGMIAPRDARVATAEATSPARGALEEID